MTTATVGPPARRPFRRRLAATAAAAACLTLVATGCSDNSVPEAPPGLTTVRIAYTQALTLLPVEVAYQRGFFKDHGLNVLENYAGGGSSQLWTTALGKQYEMVMQTPTGFLAAASQGLNIVAVAGTALNTKETPNTYVMTLRDDITSLESLVGKRVGVPNQTSASAVALNYLTMKKGLGRDVITFVNVPFPNMADQLKAGNIDAATPVVPYSTQIEAEGGRIVLEPTVEATVLAGGSDRSANAFFIADKTWAENNGEVITAFRAALDDAIEWIQNNMEEAQLLAQVWTGLPEETVKNSPLSAMSSTLTVDDLRPFAVINHELGLTEELQDVEGLILP